MGGMQLKTRIGLVRKERKRSLLLIGEDSAAFEALSGTIGLIGARDSRISLILSSADPHVLVWLRRRFPSLRILALPFSNRLSAGLYLQRLKIRAAVFAESNKRSANRILLATLKQRAIGVVTVSARGAAHLPADEPLRAASEAFVVVSNAGGKQSSSNGERYLTDVETVDMLAVMLGRDLKALREGNLLGRIAARMPLKMAASTRWRGAVGWRVRRFEDARELKERLGSPKIILCLGNGPSSEDPTLESMKFDVLFRVNHSWLKRNGLAKPGVVFTGGQPTMKAVSGSIFGLPTSDAGERLMLARGYNPLMGRTEFFNVNDVADSLKQFDWGHLRPTNGACMLATAIALNPEKLIVAGIDLFQHSEGSYPGDATTPNAYSPGHSRETELDFILRLFSGFKGEIVIVGEILQAAWRQRAPRETSNP